MDTRTKIKTSREKCLDNICYSVTEDNKRRTQQVHRNVLYPIFLTLDMSHLERSPLNRAAPLNMYDMSVILDMSHFETSPLNLEAPLNTTRNERSKYDEEEKIKKVSFQRFRGLLYDRRHERRTALHVYDTGHVPLRNIAVELRGTLKHYKKRKKQIR